MEELILISYLNDFMFCPVSIYFHKLYGNMESSLYQVEYQINGKSAHKTIDSGSYSTSNHILQGIEVYSEEFGIIGKIDIFDSKKGILTERKNKINEIFDGYIFQLYAQYYALKEMGYTINKIRLYSLMDNKIYDVDLPEKNITMQNKFKDLIKNIRNFSVEKFEQTNRKKCEKCIYEPSCDRSLLC